MLATAHGLPKHLLRIDVPVCRSAGNSGTRKSHVLETLLCPRPGLLKAAGSSRWPVQFGSDSAEGQPRDPWGRITKKMSGRDDPITAQGSGPLSRCSRTVAAVYNEGTSRGLCPLSASETTGSV